MNGLDGDAPYAIARLDEHVVDDRIARTLAPEDRLDANRLAAAWRSLSSSGPDRRRARGIGEMSDEMLRARTVCGRAPRGAGERNADRGPHSPTHSGAMLSVASSTRTRLVG